MYEKSVAAKKASPAPRMDGLADALISTGYCYDLIGEYNMAIKYLKETQAVAKKLRQEGNVAISLNNIGNVYYS